jgi:hypothetical protein
MGLSFIKSSSSLKVFIHTPNQIFEMENKEQSYSSFKKKKRRNRGFVKNIIVRVDMIDE